MAMVQELRTLFPFLAESGRGFSLARPSPRRIAQQARARAHTGI